MTLCFIDENDLSSLFQAWKEFALKYFFHIEIKGSMQMAKNV